MLKEPSWPSQSACRSMVNLLEKETVGAYRLDRSTQSALNNMTFTIAKKYTPGLAQVKASSESDLVFDRAKVFPIHTLEWCLATLEIAHQHRKEFSWVGEAMIAKTKRTMRKTYGKEITDPIIEAIERAESVKNLDWNRTIYSMLADMYEKGVEYGLDVFSEIVWSVAKKSWATRDVVDIKEIIEAAFGRENLHPATKIGIAMFDLASHISAKPKQA